MVDDLYNMMASETQMISVVGYDESDDRYVVEVTDDNTNINSKFGMMSHRWAALMICSSYDLDCVYCNFMAEVFKSSIFSDSW